MLYNKIVIAGGSGYIGSVLSEYFKSISREIVILSRRFKPKVDNIRTVTRELPDLNRWKDELEGIDLLINLTGKNVNCRYNDKNKFEILNSRLDAVKALGKCIDGLNVKPKLWVNVCSATIYRHAEDMPQDEFVGEFGDSFSEQVCKEWEKVFFDQKDGVRKVALRTAIVLGMGGGAFPQYLKLAKYGLGGKQGNGRQKISWIHEQEIAHIIEFLYQNEHLSGVFNASAPEVVDNNCFMQLIRQKLGAKFGLPANKLFLKIGAFFMKTETELILKSRWVLPTRLLNERYIFKYPLLKDALDNLVD